MYDIIGDIHGHALEFVWLLDRMGYQRRKGVFSHPERQAVFVGDFIDRGPQIAEVLRIVRRMVEAGHAQAVMGNHEFNAIAYHTTNPAKRDQYLREHNDKNNHQHAETLRQLTADELSDALDWFRTLPMSLDLDGIRVVHACWDDCSIRTIDAARNEFGRVNESFMRVATDKESALYHAVEDVLKGKELPLPEGASFEDKDGTVRTKVRIRWFENSAGKTFREFALPSAAEIPETVVPEAASELVTPYETNQPPVFIGHYWLKADRPTRLAPNVACVDYSVAKGGSLCAYRWDGKAELNDDNFVSSRAAS